MGELSWFLFLAKALRISLRVSEIRGLFESNSSVCALLLCDLESRGLITGKIDKSTWNSWLNDSGLRSEMWLYAYEATRKGWSGKNDRFLLSAPQFNELYRQKVSFYNESRHFLKVSKKVARERRSLEKEKLAYRESLDEITFDALNEFALDTNGTAPFDYDDVYS